MRVLTGFLFGIFVFLSLATEGQPLKSSEAPLNESEKLHSPHKASVYSAILPGLGQAYNKKYWKIPIVYAGIGTLTYFAITNRKEYLLAKEAFIYVSNEEEYPIDNKYVGKYEANDLITIRDYYRRNTEVSWIFMGLWYVLNIVDATVDAHLFYYDISDELSVHMSQPESQLIMTAPPFQGNLHTKQLLTLKYSF